MSSKFFNNTPNSNLFQKFCDIAHQMCNFHTFQAVVGYFRSSGYFKLRAEFENVKKIQILVGIDVDKLFRKQSEFFFGLKIDENAIREAYSKNFREEIKEANYDAETEKGILQFCDDICSGKLEIRIHKSKDLHAKFYLLLPENHTESSDGWVIMGSSNLSDSGLGTKDDNNRYELNVAMKDYDDVNYCKEEFQKLWADALPLSLDDMRNMKNQTHLTDELPTPYELYMKVLIDTFGLQVEDDFSMDLPDGVMKIRYQQDAVIQGYQMLLQHNGFILADVVGLGKTIVATMIAKRFIHENDNHHTKILVIYPPAVAKNWKDTFKRFNISNYAQFISNGSLSKILEGKDNFLEKEYFDLIIVDEAHNFRSGSALHYDELQKICKSPRRNRGKIFGPKKVMLLSATPLNNKPDDIKNLLLLFQDAHYSTIEGVQNLDTTFAPWIKEYNNIMKERRKDESNADFAARTDALYEEIRTKIIDKVTVRRTRNNIKNVPAYKADLGKQKIVFPEILPPKSLEYELKNGLNELFYDTMFILTDTKTIDNPEGKGLHYARYRAIEFLVGKAKAKYNHPENIAATLMGVYRVHMVKRLESSFEAFKKSLHTLLKITEDMIRMFQEDKVFIASELKIKDKIDKGWELDQIIEYAMEQGFNIEDIVYKASDFNPEFVKMLEEDVERLSDLCSKWDAVQEDPKLDLFIQKIKSEFFKKVNNPTGKLVIFSESVDTVNYLTDAIQKKLNRNDVINICASNRKANQEILRTCFDANVPKEEQSNAFNIVITSDVLAEGVNLHRANVIINYDSPWNATRLMQRIGRVNRIGSVADKIYNYMFYPSHQGDEQIHLYSNALIKLQGFHSALGEDTQIYSREELVREFQLFNPEITDNVDRSLKLLEEVRELFQKDRGLYNKIKNLPMKSRTVRDIENCAAQKVQTLSTLVFLSSPKKVEYYLVNQNEVSNVAFLDAMDMMRADVSEKPEPMRKAESFHYTQVNLATQQYKTESNEQVHPDSMNARKNDPTTSKALSYIRALMRALSQYSDIKEKLEVLRQLVEQGTYAQLRTKLNKFAKDESKEHINASEAEKRRIEFIDKLYKEYSSSEEISKEESNEPIKPKIIVSESFI